MNIAVLALIGAVSARHMKTYQTAELDD
jgi:hypothetical protein